MVQQSLIKRTREAKKNAAIAVIAMKMAKDNGDVYQKKAAKFKKLFIAAKQAILKKYALRARQEWMKRQSTSTASTAPKASKTDKK